MKTWNTMNDIDFEVQNLCDSFREPNVEIMGEKSAEALERKVMIYVQTMLGLTNLKFGKEFIKTKKGEILYSKDYVESIIKEVESMLH